MQFWGLVMNLFGAVLLAVCSQVGVEAGFDGPIVFKKLPWKKLSWKHVNMIGWGLLVLGFSLRAVTTWPAR
jgi:hypothetical protein